MIFRVLIIRLFILIQFKYDFKLKKSQSVIFLTRKLLWIYLIRSSIYHCLIYKSISIRSNSINLLANSITLCILVAFIFHFIHLYFTVKVNEHLHVVIICKILILITRNGVSLSTTN